MKLVLFIRDTLADITQAIHNANAGRKRSGAMFSIRPALADGEGGSIDYDIAVVPAMDALTESKWSARVVGPLIREKGEPVVANPTRIKFTVTVNEEIR